MATTPDSTTQLIVQAAHQHGIKTRIVSPSIPDIIELEKDGHRELIYFSCTNRLGHITFKIFLSKPHSTILLKEGGFPAPEEIVTDNETDTAAFLQTHRKIVIKPLNSVWGQGVTPGITQAAQLKPAIDLARSFNQPPTNKQVVCQQHIDGTEYRILVVHQQHIFAVHRIPAHVVADGKRSIEQLIEAWNENVQADRHVAVNETTQKLLSEQGWSLASIPPSGKTIFLNRVANAHAGGIVHDATGSLGPAVREMAVQIATYFDVPVIGIDCISPDIQTTIGYVIELNSTPDLALHHSPTKGASRNPAAAIVDMLFPETARNG